MINQIEAAIILLDKKWDEASKLDREQERLTEKMRLLQVEDNLRDAVIRAIRLIGLGGTHPSCPSFADENICGTQ